MLVGLGEGVVPGFEAGGEVLDEVGFLGGEVVAFGGIVGEVVEFDLAACAMREVELPVLPAQGGIGFLGVHFPEQGLGADVDAAEEGGGDVFAIEVGGVEGHAGDGAQGWQPVGAAEHGLGVHSACWHFSRPADDEGCADAAFVVAMFSASDIRAWVAEEMVGETSFVG